MEIVKNSVKKRIELDYMNGIACLLVVLIHVLSIGIERADRTTVFAALMYFPWRLSAFVVPMFLFTGAVKMALQFRDTEITPGGYFRYILRRVRKIYLPYVLWVIIYYAAFLHIGYVRGSAGELLSYLFIGNLASPFYYIVIVMQFYFLMPLWMFIVRKTPFSLAIAGSVLITICSQRLGYILQRFSVTFLYSDRIFTSYLFFWVLGLFAGADYEKAFRFRLKTAGEKIGCAVIVLMCAVPAFLLYRGVDLSLPMIEVKMIADALSIFLLHSFCSSLTSAGAPVQAVARRLGEDSFLVYLSHCLFLTLLTYHMQRLGFIKLSVLLPARFVVCYSLPFLLCALIRKLRSVAAAK